MPVLRETVALFMLILTSNALYSVYCADPNESDDKVISNMKKVKDKIFKDYDKDVRPALRYNDTTIIYLEISPDYLIGLDEEKSLFTLDSLFIFDWVDQRLQWNPTEFGDITSIRVTDHEVWKPDLRVLNGHSRNIEPMKYGVPVIIHSDGTVWWFPPTTVTTICDVRTPSGWYPRDTHQCDVIIESWSLYSWQLDFQLLPKPMEWDYFANTNPRWEVDTEKSDLKVVGRHECCVEDFTRVLARIFLKRRPPAQVQVVWSSSLLVMTLTLAMFWIPSDSGKKISLGACLFIILTVLTIYCAALTRSPRTPPLAVSFVQATMIAVSVAIFFEIIIINLAHISGPRRPPEFAVSIMSSSLSNYICVWVPWKQSSPGDKFRLNEDAEAITVVATPKQEWLVVATGIDRVLFILYIVIFAAIH